MRQFELKVDVSSAVDLPGPLEVAATVFLPDTLPPEGRLSVIAAFPGGGYSRGYFNMRFPGRHGYSQAEHHTAAGFALIAGDHLGVGESTIPDLTRLTMEMIAAGNDHAVRTVLKRLQSRTLAPQLPALLPAATIGIGQSMGGCITVIMQARHRTYDAIGVLGYSAIHTVLPQRSSSARLKSELGHMQRRGAALEATAVATSSASIEDFVYPFHWEDVPADVLQADMSGGYPIRRTAPPFGSATIPACAVQMMSPGCIAEDAATVAVPVFVGVGERDVCPEPLQEPKAYSSSRDVSVYVVPGMAHMHNFATTRAQLWDRLTGWARLVMRC